MLGLMLYCSSYFHKKHIAAILQLKIKKSISSGKRCFGKLQEMSVNSGFLYFISCLHCFFSRYPTNKWIKLGTFHARDERNVQSFPLDEQMYAKYVKVT